ncbi:Cholecystokinin receptor type A [Tupaia chinensis]|uniref:Cholecystokinin receptor type A n=1 Tax=Tupaia chinensis TaxID=246437 RepID=L9KFJ4_TUPCH|nr:Cholecystokinin receptor type A [Tupaia chinensis]
MDVVDSLLVNGSNITLPCELRLENETFFCLDQPNPSKEWQPAVQISLYSLIFLLSVLGNTLVITVLIRNKRMRTVTNIFLLSLAVSDLMLCLFCMPFNLIPNLLKDFIFGSAVCKTTTYFMGTSVSVSTFNLVAISLERYGAICKPLQSRVWQTKSHALKVIAATWCLSFTIMTPYPIYSNLVPYTKNNNQTANMCRFLLPNDVMQQSWHTFLLLILFLIPGIVMMVAYGLISLELYQGIKFDASQKKSVKERKASTGSSGRPEDSDGCYLQRPRGRLELQQLSGRPGRIRSSSSAANLAAKKRVVRMLIVIVVLFFLCWMPIFSANAWRAYDPGSAERRLSGTPISFILLLSYSSACVNPIIYSTTAGPRARPCRATPTATWAARLRPERAADQRGRGGKEVRQTPEAEVKDREAPLPGELCRACFPAFARRLQGRARVAPWPGFEVVQVMSGVLGRPGTAFAGVTLHTALLSSARNGAVDLIELEGSRTSRMGCHSCDDRVPCCFCTSSCVEAASPWGAVTHACTQGSHLIGAQERAPSQPSLGILCVRRKPNFLVKHIHRHEHMSSSESHKDRKDREREFGT